MEDLGEMKIKCPACRADTAKSIMKEINIPHFGDVLETTIICESCGFKHSDVITLEQKEPKKFVLKITKDSLFSRVVRSQSATVSIPEVGVKVEPGPKSEGYVTNVEGIIVRFQEAVDRAMNLFCSEESQKNAKNTQDRLNALINGEIEATLIIEDPFGQSNVEDDNVEISSLTEEELKDLKTGFSIIENKEE